MAHLTTENEPKANKNRQWNRKEIASNLIQFERVRPHTSQRQAAKELGVPRTTLRYWLARKDSLDASPVVAAFFEHPDGLAFLHRLVIAAQFVMSLHSNGSIRMLCLFLKLSGLNSFVASSYGAQQKIVTIMEHEVAAFGRLERARLAPIMKHKKITVCEDETFHPEICLVAIEPISNFILLESYAEQRDTKTWTGAMQSALSDLPVNIIQVASDEAKALICHAKTELGAHHSPDLFHGLHEIGKGIFLPLSSQIKRAKKEHGNAIKVTQRLREDRLDWERQLWHKPGKSPDFEKQIDASDWREVITEVDLEEVVARKDYAQEILNKISDAYHPFDLATGNPRQVEHVEQLLAESFAGLDTIAQEASLSERAIQHIDKARRLTPSMLETITFFWNMISITLKELDLSPNIEQVMLQNLIPAYYLLIAAGKAPISKRRAILSVSGKLLAPLRASEGPFTSLKNEQVRHLELVARECAGFFQRSSSCVEGRNGHLSLRHHSQHNISDRKLQALTVIHNFGVERPDGTTAAERFFGNKPENLFQHLLDQIDLPARPAKRRSQPTPQQWLVAA